MKNCIKCGREKADIELGHYPGPVCRGCFFAVVERRARKQLRVGGLLSRGDKIVILDDGSIASEVVRHIMSPIFRKLKTRIIKERVVTLNEAVGRTESFLKKNNADKVIVPWCADLEAEYLLSRMASKDGISKGGKTKGSIKEESRREIRFPKSVSESELKLFAELKGFKGKPMKPYDPMFRSLLDSLEPEHPEIKFAVVRSFEKL